MGFLERIKGIATTSAKGQRRTITSEEKADIEEMESQGLFAREIAEQLDLNHKTVSNHIAILRRKKGSGYNNPLAENRYELDKIRLEIEKSKLNMQLQLQQHELELQKLELQNEMRGDDEEEEDSPEGMFEKLIMAKLMGGVGVPQAAPTAQTKPAHVSPRAAAAEEQKTLIPKEEKDSIPEEQIPALVDYIEANNFTKEQTIAEAKKYGYSEKAAANFYDAHIEVKQ